MSILERYKQELLSSIPVVAAMDVQIEDVKDNSITLGAPLNTNINYEGTAFGGSLNTVCILSCYLLVHHLLKSKDVGFSSLVIQDSQIKYLLPVNSDFSATSVVTPKSEEMLLKMLDRKKQGRIQVKSAVKTNDSDDNLVEFSARFVITK